MQSREQRIWAIVKFLAGPLISGGVMFYWVLNTGQGLGAALLWAGDVKGCNFV